MLVEKVYCEAQIIDFYRLIIFFDILFENIFI